MSVSTLGAEAVQFVNRPRLIGEGNAKPRAEAMPGVVEYTTRTSQPAFPQKKLPSCGDTVRLRVPSEGAKGQ